VRLYVRVARISKHNERNSYSPRVTYGLWHRVREAYLLPVKEHETLCDKNLLDPVESLESSRTPTRMCSQCEKLDAAR
jgi:hypothetical protein